MLGRGRAASETTGRESKAAKGTNGMGIWDDGGAWARGTGCCIAVLCSAVRCGAPGGLVVRARPWRHRESRSLARGGGRMGRAGSSIQYYNYNTWHPIRARAPRSTRAPAAYAGGKAEVGGADRWRAGAGRGGAAWAQAIMLASAIPKSPSSRTLDGARGRGVAWHATDGMGRPLLGVLFSLVTRLNDLLILILPPCGVDRGFAARPTSHGQLHHSTRGQGMPPTATGRAPSHSMHGLQGHWLTATCCR